MSRETGVDKELWLEVIREFWLERDRLEAAKEEERRARYDEEERRTRHSITELTRIPLDTFRGLQGQLVQQYSGFIQYATTAVYRESLARSRSFVLLRLNDDFTPPNIAGHLEDLLPGVDLSFYGEEFTFSMAGTCGCTIMYLDDGDERYIELGTSDSCCLAAHAFFALSLENYEPFYEALIDYISRILPFDVGSIELAGYEDTVEKCERIISYDDPRTMKRHILLAGPPGCGKSMILKQVAKNHPEFVRFNLTQTRNWLGWITLFAKILEKCSRRVLLVIDEIDELGLSREKDGDSVYELLRIMDGTANTRSLVLIASTNRLCDLDPALLRAGRFGPVIHVREPNAGQKRMIIEYYADRYGGELDADRIISGVDGFYSGADIRVSVEECLIRGTRICTDNVIMNLMEVTRAGDG